VAELWSRPLLPLVLLYSGHPSGQSQPASIAPAKTRPDGGRDLALHGCQQHSGCLGRRRGERRRRLVQQGSGARIVENFVPATAHTLYRLASISKSLTATGAMLLWQQGKLDLDLPIQKYCPDISTEGYAHYHPRASGAPRLEFGTTKTARPTISRAGNTKHFSNPIQGGIDFFKNDPLVAKPGTEFHYSTQGFTLVGCAIEGASGEDYVDYIRHNVLMPGGMTHTVADNRLSIVPFRARFYSKDTSGAITNAEFLDSSYKIPGGGWLSSADDMAQFEIAMLNDRIVARSTRDLMWTPLKPTDGKPDDYGLGWATSKTLGVFEVGHDGGQPGTSTAFKIVPERRAGVVVLINLDGGNAHDLATELLKIILSGSPPSRK
jgi:serine beta-lactamase-like protein LACTB